jgi:hypothetical protein
MMKKKLLLLVPLFTVMVGFNSVFYDGGIAEMTFNLASYQWKNRVIVIFATSSASENYRMQRDVLDNRIEGVLDRHLIVLDLFENERSRLGDLILTDDAVKKIKNIFDLKQDQFQVILLGKDGTIKLRSDKPVPASEFFELIDAMPMRKEEMRRKTK